MKISKFISHLLKICRLFSTDIKHFGFIVAYYKLIYIETRRLRKGLIKNNISIKKHRAIIKYLEKILADDIKLIRPQLHQPFNKTTNEEPIIWQCWWQGREQLEGITQICTNSVQRFKNNHKVILITFDNVKEYVDLPKHIYTKFEEGKISLTEMSDIMRISLLNQHGGLWIDATVLVTAPISDEIFSQLFFTCKEERQNYDFVSEYRWATFCMGGTSDNPIFKFVSQMFYKYWEKEDTLIDYYLFDYLIELGYKHIPIIKNIIDEQPYNHPNKHNMQPLLNKVFNKKTFKSLLDNTTFFKLSRKSQYIDTVSNKKTLYKVLSEEFNK